jgi:FlaA1/EpsC-like NDP-sugar epimerase
MQTLSLEEATRKNAQRSCVDSQWWKRVLALTVRSARPGAILAAEVSVAVGACMSSIALLSQFGEIADGRLLYWRLLAASAAAALLATTSTGLYRRSLRHANILDIRPLVQTVAISSALLEGFLWSSGSDKRIGVILVSLDALALLLGWELLHFMPRAWSAHLVAQRTGGIPAVVVGAGDAGLALVKETVLDRTSPFRPVALADDDCQKWGRTLFGIPVLGPTRDLAKIASRARAEAILVCIPSATHAQMYEILNTCRHLNLPVRSLPSLSELLGCRPVNKISPRHLMAPRIEHLLQRDEFAIDDRKTRRLIEGKAVLVTGAGGSIGSELARQIAAACPRKLLLLDKSENSLFYIHLEIAERMGSESTKPILADLSSISRVRSVMKAERPDLVFHAAAHKHVSMVELHPEEAIRNNVLGTRNLAEAALASGVASFVNISTDKAVDPCSFMGLSKKITELCIQEFSAQASASGIPTKFSNVRFGNVAGSTGSVVRLFWEQIQRGGPIRVTDPQASRYFMSVTEAVHLILGAAELGKLGETFVFEMGNPFNIYELAKTMALFSGLRPHRDLAIEFTGLRKGEKLSEQLWDQWERPIATTSKRILAIRERDPRSRGILLAVQQMERAIETDDNSMLMSRIAELFPRFGGRTETLKQVPEVVRPGPNFAVAGPVEAA